MSQKTVAKLAVELVGRDAQLRQTLERSKKDGADWGQSMANAAKVGAAGIATVATTAIAATTAISNFALQNATLGRELRAVAAVGNTSVVEFQAMTHAAREYNIEQGKTGDILKDLQDKLGDAAATGGGEMADFFDNVGNAAGLTVEKLQAMAGPDALIAIKQAMDQANVPMAQQVFYLESIADEASKLMPLLAEGGAKYAQLRAEFLATNSALTDSEITQFDSYAKDVDLMKGSFGAFLREAIMPFVDELEEGAEYMTQLFSGGRADLLDSRINSLHTEMVELQETLRDSSVNVNDVEEDFGSLISTSTKAAGAVEASTARLRSGMQQITAEDLAGAAQRLQDVRAELELLQERRAQLTGKPSGKAGDDGGPDSSIQAARLKSDQEAGAALLAQLQQQFAAEGELVALAHETRLEQIAEMQLSEQELARTGHESMALLREELRLQSKEKMDADLLEIEDRERQSQERRLAQERAFWDRRTQEWIRTEQQKTLMQKREAERREQIEQDLVDAKFAIGKNALEMGAAMAKEGSKAQRALLAASKGVALAESMIALQVAIAKANKVGFPANIPLIAQATSIGLGAINTIKSVNVAGMAHSGMDYIPQEGTWLLDKGERVLSPRQNADLTKFMEGGAGGGAITVVINEAPGSNEKNVRQERGPDGRMLLFIDERVRNVVNEDASRGTGIARTLERTYGLTRQGFA